MGSEVTWFACSRCQIAWAIDFEPDPDCEHDSSWIFVFHLDDSADHTDVLELMRLQVSREFERAKRSIVRLRASLDPPPPDPNVYDRKSTSVAEETGAPSEPF